MTWSHLEGVLQVSDSETLWRHAAQFAHAHGFERYSFVRRAAAASGDPFFIRHNFRADFNPRYAELTDEGVERHDPQVMHVVGEQPPTAWSRRDGVATTRPDIERRVDAVLERVEHVGIRSGITIPLPARGARWTYMCFISSEATHTRQLLPLLAATHTYAHFVQAALRRIDGAPRLRLTPREAEVLRWSALGKSSWEIGRILAISESTVNFHLAGAARRLGTRGRRAAVARALALGAIEL